MSMKNKLSEMWGKVTVMAAIIAASAPMRALADDLSWLQEEPDGGPFGTINNQVKGVMSGALGIVRVLGIGLCVIGIVGGAISYRSDDARKKSEGKDRIKSACIAAAIIGAAITIVSFLINSGDNLGQQLLENIDSLANTVRMC